MRLYNIALIPSEKSTDVINCADHFSEIADQYLLGDASLPHVTLYQFSASEDEYSSIHKKLQLSGIVRSIDLSFNTFSCITFDQKVHWASLMPDKVDELNQMHKTIAGILGQPVKPNYDPHMTLMSTRQSDYELLVNQVKLDYKPIKDKFILSIGESDAIGQYVKVIEQFDGHANASQL